MQHYAACPDNDLPMTIAAMTPGPIPESEKKHHRQCYKS